ncbi:hypothetical protein OROGR_023615 [Orobanche gracilis]
MMTDTCQRKATKLSQVGAQPPEPERLPCPRCDSPNTKFCYYNNYNFSQPRHFCKSCRRYWTRGGTLRDIPIGGGTRKNAKRCRTGTTSSASVASVFSSTHHDGFRHFPTAASQLLDPIGADHGTFTSLLNSHPGSGFMALGEFGYGVGTGLGDMGCAAGRSVWPFPTVVEGGPSSWNGGVSSVGGQPWQLENRDGGFAGSGDYFTWPDLAISTPGSVLK